MQAIAEQIWEYSTVALEIEEQTVEDVWSQAQLMILFHANVSIIHMLTLTDRLTKEPRTFLVRKKFNGGSFCKRIQAEENRRRLILFRFSLKELKDRNLKTHFDWLL